MSSTSPARRTPAAKPHLLVLNSGSSSLKFAIYALGADEELRLAGKLTRIGLSEGRFEATVDTHQPRISHLPLPDHPAALRVLFAWLQRQPGPWLLL